MHFDSVGFLGDVNTRKDEDLREKGAVLLTLLYNRVFALVCCCIRTLKFLAGFPPVFSNFIQYCCGTIDYDFLH